MVAQQIDILVPRLLFCIQVGKESGASSQFFCSHFSAIDGMHISQTQISGKVIDYYWLLN